MALQGTLFVQIVQRGEIPYCDKCGSLIKPDIVLYGENLPMSVLRKAETVFSQADLTLILGSSLTVYPAASLPKLTSYYGGKVVIVNADSTDQDKNATLIFRDLEQTFTAINTFLDQIS